MCHSNERVLSRAQCDHSFTRTYLLSKAWSVSDTMNERYVRHTVLSNRIHNRRRTCVDLTRFDTQTHTRHRIRVCEAKRIAWVQKWWCCAWRQLNAKMALCIQEMLAHTISLIWIKWRFSLCTQKSTRDEMNALAAKRIHSTIDCLINWNEKHTSNNNTNNNRSSHKLEAFKWMNEALCWWMLLLHSTKKRRKEEIYFHFASY